MYLSDESDFIGDSFRMVKDTLGRTEAQEIEIMSGYLDQSYAESLREFGAPFALKKCSGWLLKRPIPQTSSFDAMGCYPLFACKDWSKLHDDLEELSDDLVSVCLVTDPFGEFDTDLLRK
jgi:hypothetical protein